MESDLVRVDIPQGEPVDAFSDCSSRCFIRIRKKNGRKTKGLIASLRFPQATIGGRIIAREIVRLSERCNSETLRNIAKA